MTCLSVPSNISDLFTQVNKIHTLKTRRPVTCLSVPSNVSDLFIQVNKIHMLKTRSSSSGNFYIKFSSLSLNQRSFARCGAKLWNSYQDKFRQLPKSAFKKHVHDVPFSILEAEDDYVETPILLYKIVNFT